MLFNTFIFFIFLAIVLPLYYLFNIRNKKYLLLVSSYFFYGYWDWRFLSLLLTSTIIDYTLGSKIFHESNENKRKLLLFCSMAANLGILSFFKYFGFFVDNFQRIGHLFDFNLDYLHLHVILPVGISFYTFQTMSYTIDIYRREMKPTNSFTDFAVFVSFFPQLVAGPIERARTLLPQIENLKIPSKKQVVKGIHLIITGLFIKVMIGDTTGRIVDRVFGEPEMYKSAEILCALVLFSIQIYADFSGYSSIARGVGKLVGIELMKNFEQPYLSSNITEFWRRWHISLSSWLKDYLYIPLGGNRKGIHRTYVNLFITMLLGGLWHGASWNFVIWGGIHGLYLAIHKLILGERHAQVSYVYNGLIGLFSHVSKLVLTYILVTFTWLFFRSTNISTTEVILQKVFYWEKSLLSDRLLGITIAFLLMTIVLDLAMYMSKKHTFLLRVENKYIQFGVLTGLFFVTCLFMFNSEPLPFVYFQF